MVLEYVTLTDIVILLGTFNNIYIISIKNGKGICEIIIQQKDLIKRINKKISQKNNFEIVVTETPKRESHSKNKREVIVEEN